MQHIHRELRRRTHLIRIPVGSDSRTGLHSVICMCVSGCVCVFVHKDIHIWREVRHSIKTKVSFFLGGGAFFSKAKEKTFWSCSPHQTQLHQMRFTKVLWWISYFRSAHHHFLGLNVYKMIAALFFLFFFPLRGKIPTKKKDYAMKCTNGWQSDIKMVPLMVE